LGINNVSVITKPDNLQFVRSENKEIISNDDFIERENLFEEINKRLSSDNKTVLLTGMPGV
jgi:hypothetical protein